MEQWRQGRGKRRTGTTARKAAVAMLAAVLGVLCAACSDGSADRAAVAWDRSAVDTCNPQRRTALRGGPGNALGGAFIGAGGLGSLGAGPTAAATTDALEGISGSSAPLSSTGCAGAERPVTPETKAGGAE
jgi:hypothetical protein